MDHLIGLAVGVFLLLGCLDVLSFETLWKLVLPIIIILIGLTMICRNLFAHKFNEVTAKLNEKINKDDEIGAVFAGQDIKMNGEEFKGKNLSAVFGGVKLDLRKAIIKEDAVINASAIFGGVEILVPDDVVVVTKSNSFFGGVSNKTNNEPKKGAHTIYVNALGYLVAWRLNNEYLAKDYKILCDRFCLFSYLYDFVWDCVWCTRNPDCDKTN